MTLRRKVLERKRIISTALGTMLLCIPSIAQTESPQIVQQAKTATCSNVVVTGGTAVFKCSGLTEEQTKLMRDVPALLMRLLKSQQLDTTEILSRLDSCMAQGAARDLSPQVQSDLKAKLKLLIPGAYSIQIIVTHNTPESARYADKIRDTFVASGWKCNGTVYEEMYTAGPGPTGITVFAHDASSNPGNMIQQAFNALSVKANYVINSVLPSNAVEIWVGPRPNE